jgi:hypothetical protein
MGATGRGRHVLRLIDHTTSIKNTACATTVGHAVFVSDRLQSLHPDARLTCFTMQTS